jgi:prophage DNA circulation protein
LPDVSQTGAIAVLDDALQSIDTVTRRIFVNPTGLYSMISKLGQLQGNVARLLSAPRTISERLTQMVSGLAALGFAGGDSGTARQVVAAMSLLSSSGSAAAYIPAFTESRRQEAANRDAVTALVSRTAVAESVRVQTAINYDSVDDAEAMRDLLGDQIDALADVAPDAVYRSLTRLRVAMVQDITRRGADLSRVRTTTLGATLPSVVVAHALLGDARRADEIVSRNRIRHPGFVPGGVPLEIVAQ